MINQSVQIDVVVEKNEDGSYSVRLLRSSTVFVDGVPAKTTQPTEFGKRTFEKESDAVTEAARVAKHFGATATYP